MDHLSRPPKLTRTHKSWLTFTKHVAPVRLPSSRELVTVGDTLYLLNAQRAVIWKWDVGNGQDILDRPIVNSQGIIYGIALDGIAFSLDLNGNERWKIRMNGSSYFTRIKGYGNDHYLLFSHKDRVYRDPDDPDVETVSLCKDKEAIGWATIPYRAALRIQGKRIFVTTRSKQRPQTKEVRFFRGQ